MNIKNHQSNWHAPCFFQTPCGYQAVYFANLSFQVTLRLPAARP